jgi:hypothetical protein
MIKKTLKRMEFSLTINGRRGCCSFTGAAEVAVEEEVAVAPGM